MGSEGRKKEKTVSKSAEVKTDFRRMKL